MCNMLEVEDWKRNRLRKRILSGIAYALLLIATLFAVLGAMKDHKWYIAAAWVVFTATIFGASGSEPKPKSNYSHEPGMSTTASIPLPLDKPPKTPPN